MTYKTIVVHVGCGARRAERINLGVAIARTFDAHLIGVFALDIMRIPAYAAAEAAGLLQEIEEKRRKHEASQAEAEFRELVASRGEKAEWRAYTGDPVAAVAQSARCADLVVVGQIDPKEYDADCVPREFVDDLVFAAGKPVLIVPYAGHFNDVGLRPLVAWNGSREASRAVWDALPLLRRSGNVEVTWFDSRKLVLDTEEAMRSDMSGYLARHDVNARVSRTTLGELDIGAAILSQAADVAADTIVMGAYGHARLRERVLGGATRALLDQMTVPVLMSH
jgi:nucleotide-binding universal stress UspA family protein